MGLVGNWTRFLAIPPGEYPMKQLDRRTMAALDAILEDACRELPHGGDHLFRKAIAQKLIHSARKGNTTIEGLMIVARRAIRETTERKSA